MHIWHGLLIWGVVSLVGGSPLARQTRDEIQHISPPQDVRRDWPTFVHYSRGEGAEHAKVLQGFKDGIKMVEFVNEAHSSNDAVRKKYFPAKGALNDETSAITLQKIIDRMIQASYVESSLDTLSKMQILPSSFRPGSNYLEGKLNSDFYSNGCRKVTTMVHAKGPYVQFCTGAIAVAPALDQIKCPKDNELTDEHFGMASIAIQAMTYAELIWKGILPSAVVDMMIDEGIDAWKLASSRSPDLARQLMMHRGFKDTLLNANSLAWYITEVYWKLICAENANTNKPPYSDDNDIMSPLSPTSNNRLPFSDDDYIVSPVSPASKNKPPFAHN